MRKEWPSSKNFFTDFKGNAKILSILCIGEFYFITFKVLLIGGGRENNSLNLLPISLLKNFKIQIRSEAYPVENIKSFLIVTYNETPNPET